MVYFSENSSRISGSRSKGKIRRGKQVEFLAISSLLNVLYKMTIELTFAKICQSQRLGARQALLMSFSSQNAMLSWRPSRQNASRNHPK